MKKIIITALFLSLSGIASHAQETTDNTNDIWYAWIDTTTGAEGKTSRILSKQAFEISCCVKSPKYRRLLKKTEKWIQKNVDKNYKGESPLNKIQDANLAAAMIKEASEQNAGGSKLILVEFREKCN
ncbi:MAG: hypothetical protein MI921_28970 [Cytophagales bacterium]|nr:hypothetical protein [Cytophagales bacterium]